MKEVLHKGTGSAEDLPPAGDARREELKRRDDELAKAAETSLPEIHAASPKAFEVENELASQFNALEVSDADPAYVYCWVNCMSQHGYFVKSKLAERVRDPDSGRMVPVWEVVQGDMQEAIECKGIAGDTTRKIGDVMLMRCRLDYHLILQRRREARRKAQEEGVTGQLEEVANKYAKQGVILHKDFAGMDRRTVQGIMSRSVAAQQAMKLTDQYLREGRMPGAPAPTGR